MRDTIVGAIATAISTVKGIKTITDWYTDQITDDMLPLVNILDKSDDIVREGNINHHTLTVVVDVYHNGTTTALREYIDAIAKAVQAIKSLVVNDVIFEQATIEKESESNMILIASLTFSVFYTTNLEMEAVQC